MKLLPFPLLLLTLAMAACNAAPTPIPTPTDQPTATVDPTATASPTPTATPEPLTVGQVLSKAQASIASLSSFRFAVAASGNQEGQATGEWVDSGTYSLTTYLKLCPPALPDGTQPQNCDPVPAYEAIGNGADVYERPVPSAPTPSPGQSKWDTGTLASFLSPAGLQGNGQDPDAPAILAQGKAPVSLLLQQVPPTGTVVGGSLNGATVLHVTASDSSSTTYDLFLDPETYRPVQVTIAEAGTTWTWTFKDYDADITIASPQPAPSPSPTAG